VLDAKIRFLSLSNHRKYRAVTHHKPENIVGCVRRGNYTIYKNSCNSRGVGTPGSGSPLQAPKKKLLNVAIIFKIGIKCRGDSRIPPTRYRGNGNVLINLRESLIPYPNHSKHRQFLVCLLQQAETTLEKHSAVRFVTKHWLYKLR
jgi:hypothetical protein